MSGICVFHLKNFHQKGIVFLIEDTSMLQVFNGLNKTCSLLFTEEAKQFDPLVLWNFLYF